MSCLGTAYSSTLSPSTASYSDALAAAATTATTTTAASACMDMIARLNNMAVVCMEMTAEDAESSAIYYLNSALEKVSNLAGFTIAPLLSLSPPAPTQGAVGGGNSSHGTMSPQQPTHQVKSSPQQQQQQQQQQQRQQDEVSKNLYIYQRCEYDEGMFAYAGMIVMDGSVALTLQDVCATILFNLGQVYQRRGEQQVAVTALMQSLCFLQHRQSHHRQNQPPTMVSSSPGEGEGGGRVSVVAVLHNIGHVQYRGGNYHEALCTYHKALELLLAGAQQQQHGNSSAQQDHHHMLALASTLNCLGVLYFHLPQAETNKSMALYQESLAIQHAVLGNDDETVQLATTLNNMGRVHYLLGEYPEALRLYERALQIRQRLLGHDHVDVAACLYNAGQTHHQMRQFDRAMDMYGSFLVIAQRRLGPNHRDVAVICKCMAQVHHENRQHDHAAALYQRALCTARAALGNDHAEVASILNKLGNLHYECGNLTAAIATYGEGLKVERSVLDDSHPNLIVTLTNLGQIYKLRGNLPKALRMYKEAVAIQQRQQQHHQQQHQQSSSFNTKVPHFPPTMTRNLSSVGHIYYQMQDFDRALDVYQRVLGLQRDAFMGSDNDDDQHLEIAATFNSIGMVLYELERCDLALESMQKCLAIRRNLLGPHHRDVALTYSNIATIYLDMGDDEQALEQFVETLRVQRACLDPYHRDVIHSLQTIGQVHQQRGEWGDALDYFYQALDLQQKARAAAVVATANAKGNHDDELNNNISLAEHNLAIAQTYNYIGNVTLQRGDAMETVTAFSEAARHFRSAGKTENDLVLPGFQFYSLSKLHPECAPLA